MVMLKWTFSWSGQGKGLFTSCFDFSQLVWQRGVFNAASRLAVARFWVISCLLNQLTVWWKPFFENYMKTVWAPQLNCWLGPTSGDRCCSQTPFYRHPCIWIISTFKRRFHHISSFCGGSNMFLSRDFAFISIFIWGFTMKNDLNKITPFAGGSCMSEMWQVALLRQ